MKSPNTMGLTALALIAFCYSSKYGGHQVESFSSIRNRHRASSVSSPISSSYSSSSSSFRFIHSSLRQRHQRFQHQPGRGRSLRATPETKSSTAFNATSSANSNDINNANTTTTTTTAEISSASIAQVERAWTLDAPTGIDTSTPIDTATTTTTTITTTATNPASFFASHVDVLGPLVTIVSVVAFLFYTLLNTGGISDSFLTMDLPQKLGVLNKISWFPGRYQEAQLVVGLVMAFSAFAQALTGFGFAVVAVGAMSGMPWLLHSELFGVITPVAATLGATVGFILLIPCAFGNSSNDEDEDNPGLEWDQILPLLIPCTVLTPLGMQLNSMVDPLLATRVLAALIMGFVGYKLVPTLTDAINGNGNGNTSDGDGGTSDGDAITDDVITSDAITTTTTAAAPSFLQSKTAAVLLGSAAGVFGGAFDVQGPPLCVYGDAKGWSPARFRNNVLAVVCLNSALVVAIDAYRGTLGDFYYCYFCLTSLPGVLLGVVAGQYASERIDPLLFKNLVLVMCLGLGVQLLTVS